MSKYTKSAKGQDCVVRLGVCNRNPETVVFAHLNGGGMGMKRADIHGAYACSACHDELDGRTQFYSRHQNHIDFLEAVMRTQEIMIKNGVLVL